jgi:hypothetical protein
MNPQLGKQIFFNLKDIIYLNGIKILIYPIIDIKKTNFEKIV